MKTSISKIMTAVLWIALVLAMFASMHRVAYQFGLLENQGNEWMGWVSAIAIDASIVALAYGLRTRKKANKGKGSVARLWAGVGFLTFISISANFLSALSVRPDNLFEAAAFSATLPIIIILLSDITASDDERAAKKADALSDVEKENKELKRQAATTDKQMAEYVATNSSLSAEVSELTDVIASMSVKREEPVMADRTKDGFMTHMRTGNGDRPSSVPDIVALYGVSERTAYRWWTEWQSNLVVQEN